MIGYGFFFDFNKNYIDLRRGSITQFFDNSKNNIDFLV